MGKSRERITLKDFDYKLHVKVIAPKKAGKRGSQPKVECNHCGKQFKGGSDRIRTHITGVGKGISCCPAAPAVAKAKGLAAEARREERVALYHSRTTAESTQGENIGKCLTCWLAHCCWLLI
jgi:hypothetical protein